MNAMLAPMDFTTSILIVDDDPGIRDLMANFLSQHGFRTQVACGPAEMREKMARERPDLIVLDVMMPGEDGLSALRSLQQPGAPPVIMLSAVGGDVDRIIGLELGADDYLAKPCNPRELLARIRTVLRRDRGRRSGSSGEDESGVYSFQGWRLDTVRRDLKDPDGTLVTLSDSEFRLLRAFVEHPRRVLTRDQLLDYAHGADSENYDRAIDVQVSRLRRKLAVHPRSGELIRTVRNEGYMFTPVVTR